MNIRKNIILRVYAAFFLLAIVAIAILGRVFQLQNIQGDKWRKLSDSLNTKLVNVAAIRGNIYSWMVVYWLLLCQNTNCVLI